MFRKRKKSRTFKYERYTPRTFRRMYKAERFIVSNSHKSAAKSVLQQMLLIDNDYLLECKEAEIFSLLTSKQSVGYLD